MTDRELFQMALSALEGIDEAMPFPVAKMVMHKLRERLAQPDPQPCAWGMESQQYPGMILDVITPEEHDRVEGGYTVPLYRAPIK